MSFRPFPAIAVLAILLAGGFAFAQPPRQLPQVRVSPPATVSQTVGLTTITIDYSRPAMRGRTIYGDLVPWETLWRSGANENTTIAFSTPVSIQGNRLDAGTYGFHSIPGEKTWTLVFSSNSDLWGSFRYDESEDALRIDVTPQTIAPREWLQYSFPEISENSATVALAWGDRRVTFRVDIDVHETVIAAYRTELRGLLGFFPQSIAAAADYCAQNDTHHEQGMAWIDQALNRQRSFTNLRIKSQLLAQTGKPDEAGALMADAFDLATEAELNQYGYLLLGTGDSDRAIEVFRMNVKAHPDSWNTYDSLGEAYLRTGNTAEARKFYRKAHEMVTDPTQKQRIEQVLAGMDQS